MAQITDVNQGHPPPAMDRGARRWAEVLNVGFLVVFVALGFGVIWIGVEGDPEASVDPATMAVAFGVWMIGLVIPLRDSWFVGSRYLLRRLYARFAKRAELVVRPSAPDVLKVALVPRSSWNQADVLERLDYGLLTVRGATVLYEGDRVRMRIPAKCILSVGLKPLRMANHYHIRSSRGRKGS